MTNLRAEACSLELDQLFEPFVFENPLSKRNGLGLTLVAALAERLDGSIEIREQSTAHGFNFEAVLTLPRGDEAVRKAPAPATPQRPTTRWSDAISKLPDKITVAIVDDDTGISSAIEKILSLVFQKHLQFGCIKFSGPEFIAEIDKLEFFDAVVCDVNLGAVSGRFIYETLRERFPEQLNSFAFLTGERLSHEIQAFLESSGCPYLHKPFDAEYLIDLVIELIEKGATKRSS
ncbi:MAG: response regulator [Deltaproteobacteria bacterium]|nr:response regulator [Deltaproteobacteria bacterium]